jgi:type IV pilus assembly protein PilN
MIKINLLAVERKVAKKKFAFEAGQKMTVGCSALLLVTLLFIGWRYWKVQQDSKQLDAAIASAQQEAARLRSILGQVQQFEQRRQQLQQRVTLIEELRRNQKGPVHILDQISRSLPPMLWLTEMRQQGNPNEVVLVGKCTTITALTDFVANLEGTGYFKKSVEIVSTQTDAIATPPGELVTFTIRATYQDPSAVPVEAVAAAAPAAGKRG